MKLHFFPWIGWRAIVALPSLILSILHISLLPLSKNPPPSLLHLFRWFLSLNLILFLLRYQILLACKHICKYVCIYIYKGFKRRFEFGCVIFGFWRNKDNWMEYRGLEPRVEPYGHSVIKEATGRDLQEAGGLIFVINYSLLMLVHDF